MTARRASARRRVDLRVPEPVAQMALSANGEAGRAWLDRLPDLVGWAVEEWSLKLGQPYEGGYTAYVAPATRPNGERVVLKVAFLDEETAGEAVALAAWDGEGAVQLLAHDAERGALLLERLEPGVPLSDHPDRDEAISVACTLLRRLWRPAPAGAALPTATDLARRWAEFLLRESEDLGRPFDPGLVDLAAALAAERSGSSEPVVLGNRDYHLGNVLSARREPWLMIDPKPVAGERAFDTGHFLLDLVPSGSDARAVEALVDRIAGELELDPSVVRAWALIRCVDNALWRRRIGEDGEGDARLAAVLAG